MHYNGDLKDKFINQIDPIVITDLSGVILEANDKFVEITGFSLEKLCCAHITQYEQQSGKVLNYEFQNSAVIDISGSNLLTAEGDFLPADLHVCLMMSGQTQYLQWTYRIVPGSFRQDEYLAMIVHDLRTPLSNIITSLDLLDTLSVVSNSSDAQEVIRIARHSAGQLSDDLSNLLDSRHLLAGRSLIKMDWTEMSAVIQEAVALVLSAADERRQTIQCSPVKIPRLMADEDMLRRAITNLLENAVKFSPIGGEISVSAESCGEVLVITVTNSGLTAGKRLKAQIGEKPTALAGVREPRGYGLGLAFCDLAVKAHGGELKSGVNSDDGRTYSIILPLNNNFDLTGTIKDEV